MAYDGDIVLPYPSFVQRTTAYSAQVTGNFTEISDKFNLAKARAGIFNLKDYAAVGDGVANDTTAINATIAALNAAGGGILEIPKGTYLFTVAALSPITVPCVVRGMGAQASVLSTSGDGDGLLIASDHVHLEASFSIRNTGTPTSGAGIHATTGFGIKLHCRVSGFYDLVQFDDPCYGIEIGGNAYLVNFHRYAIHRPYGGLFADRGDDIIDNCTIDSSVAAAGSACIRWEAHGGLKLGSGVKLLHGDYGLDLQVADGASTSVLPIVGASMEAQAVANIRLSRSGTTGTYSFIEITGVELSAAATNVIVGAGITSVVIGGGAVLNCTNSGVGVGVDVQGGSDVLIDGVDFANHGKAIQIASATQQVTVGINSYRNVTTPVEDSTSLTTTQAAPVHHKHRRQISVTSSVTYTNRFQIDLSTFRGCRIELVIEGLLQGIGNGTRVIRKIVAREAAACVVQTLEDVAYGSPIDVQFDTATTSGSVLIGLRRNAAGGGAQFDALVTLNVDGHALRITRL